MAILIESLEKIGEHSIVHCNISKGKKCCLYILRDEFVAIV